MTPINVFLYVLVYGTYLFCIKFEYFHNLFHITNVRILCCARAFIHCIKEVFTTFIHTNITITLFFFHIRRSRSLFVALIIVRTQSFFVFTCFVVPRNRYVYAFQLHSIHQHNSRLNCFVGVSNCLIDIQFNYFGRYLNVLLDFNFIRNLFH